MYFDKRVRSSMSRTATILKYNMSCLFNFGNAEKTKIDVNVNIYLTIICRRRGEYLVNEPLRAAGMSADNVRG